MYLYLKTHNVTGLKYLGKTIRNPFKYKGSGKRWKYHLNKHGNDVSTEILLETNDVNELVQKGIELSIKWNIVERSDFANIRIECGDGGDTSKTPAYIEAMKHRQQIPWNKGLKFPPHTKERRQQISQTLKQHWKTHTHNRKGVVNWNRGIPNPRIREVSKLSQYSWKCQRCGKEGVGASNLKRWHGDNCRLAHNSN